MSTMLILNVTLKNLIKNSTSNVFRRKNISYIPKLVVLLWILRKNNPDREDILKQKSNKYELFKGKNYPLKVTQ